MGFPLEQCRVALEVVGIPNPNLPLPLPLPLPLHPYPYPYPYYSPFPLTLTLSLTPSLTPPPTLNQVQCGPLLVRAALDSLGAHTLGEHVGP